ASQHAHEDRTCGLAATRSTDEQAPPPDREVQQRKEHEAAVGLTAGQVHLCLRIAEAKTLMRTVVVLNVVVRADAGVVDDPEVGLPELLVERDLVAAFLARRDRSSIEVGDVERRGCAMFCTRIGRRLSNVPEPPATDLNHATVLPSRGESRRVETGCDGFP